jgi:tetratricopeptide (TPR) repeat protein
MNRSTILSILLGIVIVAGILFLFPSLWVLLLLVLLLLISTIVVLARRNIRVVTVLPPQPAAAPATGSGSSTSEAAPPDGASADEAPVVDSELFSRFRAQMERAEQGGTGDSPPEPAGSETTPDAVNDSIHISDAARQQQPAAPATGRRSAALPSDDEVDVDIFDDLRTDHAAVTGGSTHAKEPPPRQPEAPPTEEMLLVPSVESGQDDRDDAPALLNMAEEALTRNDVEGARAGLDNYFSAMAGHDEDIPWQAHLARMRLATADNDASRAQEQFELMLGRGYEPTEESFPDLLDGALAPMEADDAAPLRVSLLVRILAVYRQAGERPAMDRLYRLIETAQEAAGDEKKLVQYLKNHLEIKKVMSDLPGQLDLIDQIGNRLYKLGETEEAKGFYETGLKLRAELEDNDAPDESAATGDDEPSTEASTDGGQDAGEESPATPEVAPTEQEES